MAGWTNAAFVPFRERGERTAAGSTSCPGYAAPRLGRHPRLVSPHPVRGPTPRPSAHAGPFGTTVNRPRATMSPLVGECRTYLFYMCVRALRAGPGTPQRIAADMDWADRGLCRTQADRMFAEGAAQNEAKAVCVHCPVQVECLAYALDHRVEHGVWGAMTERERRVCCCTAVRTSRPGRRSSRRLVRRTRRLRSAVLNRRAGPRWCRCRASGARCLCPATMLRPPGGAGPEHRVRDQRFTGRERAMVGGHGGRAAHPAVALSAPERWCRVVSEPMPRGPLRHVFRRGWRCRCGLPTPGLILPIDSGHRL